MTSCSKTEALEAFERLRLNAEKVEAWGSVLDTLSESTSDVSRDGLAVIGNALMTLGARLIGEAWNAEQALRGAIE